MAVTEKQVERALEVLMDSDHEAAKSRAAHEYMDSVGKILIAKLSLESDEKSANGREAYARAHPDYEQHVLQTKSIAEQDYTWRDRRSAATAIIDMWRTEQSNARQAGRIG